MTNMITDFPSYLSFFWMIFSFSFLVALTGAMAPGPLLTYTIIKSVTAPKRGYLMGLWIILGHAAIEMVIIIFLLMGFSFVLKNTMIVRTIGVMGGIILIYFGGSIIRDAYLKKIPTDFLKSEEKTDAPAIKIKNRGLENPMIGGILISLANPYWWVWWATIGFAFMLQFEISFAEWPKLLAFFLGHEAGDLAWYLLVSILSYLGLRRLNEKAYYGFLVVCSVFMILFGIYLGAAPFFLKG
jgi:threonine/homoserine/homoserine lactone efflux protein